MNDIMSPHPASEASARYDVSRLVELLPMVERHLIALGLDREIASQVGREALALRRTIQRARDAALREIAQRVGP